MRRAWLTAFVLCLAAEQAHAFATPEGSSLLGKGTAVGASLFQQPIHPPVLVASTSVSHRLRGSNAEGVAPSSCWYGKAILAASVCGFVASLAVSSRRPTVTRQRQGGARRVSSLENPAGQIVPVENGAIDAVETSIEDFVPKIAALQTQAESLRNGELKNVLAALKGMRKSELRGVFGEVDGLLCALIDAVDGLRESAVAIRKSELRQHFEQLDRDAQAWVGTLERDSVELLTGYRSEAKVEEVDTMMEVHVVGLSHHSAPVEVREKLAVPEVDWNAYSRELVEFGRTDNGYVVPEVAVISTCNRFELYFASPELKKYAALECVHAFLRQKSGLTRDELHPFLFCHSGEGATRHLFEVSSGLDSLVLGEAQILSQVKACHQHAIERQRADDEAFVAGSGGKIIAKMLQSGIQIGKMVRTRTKIGKGCVSVSSAAVELMMTRSMADLHKYASSTHVCVVGAGKMARLLLLALFSKHPDIQLTVVNRSVDKAQAMLDDEMVKARGGKNAKVAPSAEMLEVVRESDVVFTATGSKEPIISAEHLKDLRRKLMLVDISVPLNVAADVSEVEGVYSYNVDDLKKVQEANAEKRQAEVTKAKHFIDEEVHRFKLWQASQGAVPYLASLQARAEAIRKMETDKAKAKLKGLHDKELEVVNKTTRHIVDHLLEPMYYSLKDDEDLNDKRLKIWALKKLLKLKPLHKRRQLGGPPSKQISA